MIETYEYKYPIQKGYENNKEDYTKKADTEKSEYSLYRAREAIRRIIMTNVTEYTKLVTLTYAEANFDYKKLSDDLMVFFKYLKRKGYTSPYLYITENQKERGQREGNEGSLHAHILFFTDVYIPFKTLKDSWLYGSVDVHKLKDVKHLGAYVCKYLTKANLKGNIRAYRTSKGLKKPLEIEQGPQELAPLEVPKTYIQCMYKHYTIDKTISKEGGREIRIENEITYTQYKKVSPFISEN